MVMVHLRFRECEHNGDLDHYARDVVKCGGEVIYRELDALHEKGLLSVEFDNEAKREEFWRKFRQTDSYSFC
ncbi:hypothetical protein M5X11_28005 [Paenibacillus alginolyticus]|uniref:hypothetical protein n=1 Tax=Paenibacillus alginolyticus TaxID=59839 RepID=UPI000400C478|nr:hypothetical protein [Paenibacillus alginolyticus]MCY9668722.1 hypothetical protein [Paenibacillus alginolyticus]